MEYIYLSVLLFVSIMLVEKIFSGFLHYAFPSPKRSLKLHNKIFNSILGYRERDKAISYCLSWMLVNCVIFVVSWTLIPVAIFRTIILIAFLLEVGTMGFMIIFPMILCKAGLLLDDLIEDETWETSTTEEKEEVLTQIIKELTNKVNKQFVPKFDLSPSGKDIKLQVIDQYEEAQKEKAKKDNRWDPVRNTIRPNPILNFLNILIQFIIPIGQLTTLVPILIVLFQNL